jgi:hypothetical protein
MELAVTKHPMMTFDEIRARVVRGVGREMKLRIIAENMCSEEDFDALALYIKTSNVQLGL